MRPERRGIEKRSSNSGPSLKFRINEYKEVLGRWKKEYYVEVGMAVTYYLQVCLSSASELSPIDWQPISTTLFPALACVSSNGTLLVMPSTNHKRTRLNIERERTGRERRW